MRPKAQGPETTRHRGQRDEARNEETRPRPPASVRKGKLGPSPLLPVASPVQVPKRLGLARPSHAHVVAQLPRTASMAMPTRPHTALHIPTVA